MKIVPSITDVSEEGFDEVPFELCDCVRKDSLLAINTDEADGYFLFKADSAAYELPSHSSDDWGNTFTAGTKIIRGEYYTRTTQNILSYKLMSRKVALVSPSAILFVYNDIISRNRLKLSINVHEEIVEWKKNMSVY